VGGLTAAYWLSQPEFADRYEITIYQMGWRLGGKGASGRNARYHQRSEEHGMHIWFGFYENAFRTIQAAYKDGGAHGPYQEWTDAFKAAHEGTVADDGPGGFDWWHIHFPLAKGTPGDGTPLPKLDDFLRRALEVLVNNLDRRSDLKRALETPPKSPTVFGGIWGRIKVALARMAKRFLRRGAFSLVRVSTFLHSTLATVNSLPFGLGHAAQEFQNAVLDEITRFRSSLHQVLPTMAGQFAQDPDLRRLFMVLDLGATCILGALRDGVFTRGLDHLDEFEFLEWLEHHGAFYHRLENHARASSVLRAFYDVPFAFAEGNTGTPRLGAGVALRCLMRIGLGYKGAYLYKMQAGMGEIVFTPLYKALKRRPNVHFKFFHKVTQLELNAEGDAIERIHLDEQVRLKPGKEYEPLVTLEKGLQCWPTQPIEEHIEPGWIPAPGEPDLESHGNTQPAAGNIVLERGTESGFDKVILNVSIAGLPHVAGDLLKASDRWQRMFNHIKTIRTQCLQVWMNRTHQELGWKNGDLKGPALVAACANPLNSWMDQSVLLQTELWPNEGPPRHLVYFCGPMQETAPDPAAALAEVRAAAISMLDTYGRTMWPNAGTVPGRFSWDELYAGAGTAGVHPIDSQYVRANLNPSERYVLSVPGSTAHRLKPDDLERQFMNLYLAGDWTRNGLNVGSVEAASMSGLQVARALVGEPQVIPGEYDL
jgi:uncharacterized protein with NAD-binding domain and iron-sulfur cluster